MKVFRAQQGRVDPAVLLGIGAAAEDDLDARPSHHDGADDHEHDDFDSFSVAMDEIGEPEALVERLKSVAESHDILRMKGFVPVTGKPMRLAVQGVGSRFTTAFDQPWPADRARVGAIVVIGHHGMDETAIRDALTG